VKTRGATLFSDSQLTLKSGVSVPWFLMKNNASGYTQSTGLFANDNIDVTIQGGTSGFLAGFTLTVKSSEPWSNVNAKGTFSYNGNYNTTIAALTNSGFTAYRADLVFGHPSTYDHHTSDWRSPGNSYGRGSAHFSAYLPIISHKYIWVPVPIPFLGTKWICIDLWTGNYTASPTSGDFHLGSTNPYGTAGALLQHRTEAQVSKQHHPKMHELGIWLPPGE
jgi:hypothetical protein